MQTAVRMALVSCHDVLPAACFGRLRRVQTWGQKPMMKFASTWMRQTKTDFDNLEGTLTKQVRIISPEYSGGDTLCFHNIEKTYWYAPNIIRKVTANDITRIDLVRDKALGHSSKIQIPIGGNEIYKVTISEGGSGKIPPHRHHQADAPRGKICVRRF